MFTNTQLLLSSALHSTCDMIHNMLLPYSPLGMEYYKIMWLWELGDPLQVNWCRAHKLISLVLPFEIAFFTTNTNSLLGSFRDFIKQTLLIISWPVVLLLYYAWSILATCRYFQFHFCMDCVHKSHVVPALICTASNQNSTHTHTFLDYLYK